MSTRLGVAAQPTYPLGTSNIRHKAFRFVQKTARREHEAGPVVTTYPTGERVIETPDQFRARLGVKVCERCLFPDKEAKFNPGLRPKERHACRWTSKNGRHTEEYMNGVDAWFSDRPSPSPGRELVSDLLDTVRV